MFKLFSRVAAILALSAPALAQTLPPVPPVADAARYQSFNTALPATIGLTFPLYGDCTDLAVRVDSVVIPLTSSLWSCQSISKGTNLAVLPLPITDGEVILTWPDTATHFVEVIGSAHPRRLSNPTQPGIARRDYNVDISSLTVDVREAYDALARFIAAPGIGFGNLVSTNNLSDVANAAASLAHLGGAPLASPAFTGTPTAPTPTGGDNSTKLATTSFVQNAISHTGAFTNLASATTTDLGTVATQNVNITGTTTITSFGSSANTTSPLYNACFTGSLTLTYNATSLILPGAKSIQTQAGDCLAAIPLGSGNWRVIDYTTNAGPPVWAVTTRCGASGLKIVNDTLLPSTQVDLTAALLTLTDPQGRSVNVSSPSLTISALDTGSLSSSTWYNIWVQSNGTTASGFFSISATAPTLTSGYTYSCRLGAIRTSGSTLFGRIIQSGNVTQYLVSSTGPLATLGSITAGTSYISGTYTNVPMTGGSGSGAITTIVTSGGGVSSVTITTPGNGYKTTDTLSANTSSLGGAGSGFSVPVNTIVNPTAALPIMRQASEGSYASGTYVSFSISSFVPPTATRVLGTLNLAVSAFAIVAPNGSYGGLSSNSNPPPIGAGNAATSGMDLPFEMTIENQAAPTLSWASSSASNGIFERGFVDSVNAN